MSRNFYNNESSSCNNNCYTQCNNYGNSSSNFANYWFYMIAIFLLFGGSGFGPGSFWSDYDKIFRCSGFSNSWCNNSGSNNSSFNGNNLSNNNLSNSSLTGLIGDLSNNSNFDIGNLTDSYN